MNEYIKFTIETTDEFKARRMIKADNAYAALWEIQQKLREISKHGTLAAYAEQLQGRFVYDEDVDIDSGTASLCADTVRDLIGSIIESNGIDFDEEYQ